MSVGRPKLTIEEMRELAISKGGECLSPDYGSRNTDKLTWKCNLGHIFKMAPFSVKNIGSWCPTCSRTPLLTLPEVNQLVSKKGGKIVSTSYKGVNHKHEWECHLGHRWEATPNSVLSKTHGTWCPHCKTSKSEEICRTIFQTVFQKKFPPCRPVWLVNRDGNRLFLDGFCEELKLAFEHQGMQHYKDLPFFKKSSFEKRQNDDLDKKKKCLENGITLIVIPALFILSKITDVIRHIKEQCPASLLPNDILDISVNIDSFYSSRSKSMLDICSALAAKYGGKCISDIYISANEKLEWKCCNGHTWKASYSGIKNGSWCRKCHFDSRAYGIDVIHKIAILHNGKCLTSDIERRKSIVSMECEFGHQWATKAYNIYRGSWCPKCAHFRKRYKRIKALDLGASNES